MRRGLTVRVSNYAKSMKHAKKAVVSELRHKEKSEDLMERRAHSHVAQYTNTLIALHGSVNIIVTSLRSDIACRRTF